MKNKNNRVVCAVLAVLIVLGWAGAGRKALATGPGECWVRQELTARSMGFVVRVLARDGQKVRKGDPIVELDNRLLQAGLKEAEAALMATKVNEMLAADAVSRLSQLRGSDSVTEQQVFEARIKQSQARAAKMQAEAVVERIKTQIDDTAIKAGIAGTVKGLPNVLGLFVQPGQSLGRIDVSDDACLPKTATGK